MGSSWKFATLKIKILLFTLFLALFLSLPVGKYLILLQTDMLQINAWSLQRQLLWEHLLGSLVLGEGRVTAVQCIMKHFSSNWSGLFQDDNSPINIAWGGHWMISWVWKLCELYDTNWQEGSSPSQKTNEGNNADESDKNEPTKEHSVPHQKHKIKQYLAAETLLLNVILTNVCPKNMRIASTLIKSRISS